MQIVLDTNVLISALLKDSVTRKIILDYDGYFLFPSYIFEELEKHKSKLLEKSGMQRKDFDALLQLLLQKVTIVPDVSLNRFYKEALDIVKHIDEDDAVFFACALAHQPSMLWSDDKQLKKQSSILVLNTQEIMHLLKA